MEDEALGGQDVPQIIPRRLKGLRACMRCSLIKEYEQFYERGKIFILAINNIYSFIRPLGCENCEFLQLEGNGDQVMKVFLSYLYMCIQLF